MRSSYRTVAAIVLAFAALVAAQPEHLSAQTQATGFKGRVGIRATPNSASGLSGGGSAIWDDLLPGESRSFLVTAASGGACISGVAGPLPLSSPDLQARVAKQEASAKYVWHFDIRMIDVKVSTITFDLSWQRTSRNAPDERLQYVQRLTLRDKESRAIDLIHGAPGSACLSLAISVEAGITDDPSLQSKMLEWELWASAGRQTSALQPFRSVQGDAAEFRFDPLAARGGATGQQVEFSGTVTGRVRLDGDIDVALTVRRIDLQPLNQKDLIAFFKDADRWLGPGRSGAFQKTFTAKPGEAVKIVLPGAPVSPLVKTSTDPATGERTAAVAVPASRPQNGATTGNEMSITVQARVR